MPSCWTFKVFCVRALVHIQHSFLPEIKKNSECISFPLILFLSVDSSQPASCDRLQQTAHVGAWSADVWDRHGNNSVCRQVPPCTLHYKTYAQLQFPWRLNIYRILFWNGLPSISKAGTSQYYNLCVFSHNMLCCKDVSVWKTVITYSHLQFFWRL